MFGVEDECKTGQFLSEKLTKAKKVKMCMAQVPEL